MQFDLQLNPLLNLQSVFQFHLEVVVWLNEAPRGLVSFPKESLQGSNAAWI
jgi:hypothetical protein